MVIKQPSYWSSNLDDNKLTLSNIAFFVPTTRKLAIANRSRVSCAGHRDNFQRSLSHRKCHGSIERMISYYVP